MYSKCKCGASVNMTLERWSVIFWASESRATPVATVVKKSNFFLLFEFFG
jgi:hypothetical protein